MTTDFIDEEVEKAEETFVVALEDDGARLDKFLADRFSDCSRAYLQRLIAEGDVEVDGRLVKQNHRLVEGSRVVIAFAEPERPDHLVPEDLPLEVVYEDPDILVIDKPAGMVVHPAPGHTSGTVVNALLWHQPQLSVSGTERPGIVHRLDKNTSGLLAVGKTDRGYTALLQQWAKRTVEKRYIALVRNQVEPERGVIDAPIGRDVRNRLRMAVTPSGRPSETEFQVDQRFVDATLLSAKPVTGRTHQIRVHLAFIGHPIVGDAVYNQYRDEMGGDRAIVARQFLHAAGLAFDNADGQRIELESSLPADLASALARLRQR